MNQTNPLASACQIVSVGKRRDGGTRYWCLRHKADATAKYGRRAKLCRYAHIPEIDAEDSLLLDLDRHEGCVALWGAVPPVYDTTAQPLDRGVHVHARLTREGDKVIDRTYRMVRLVKGGKEHSVSELEAIYFMVSSVFGLKMKQVLCTYCLHSHLDKDWFSVHSHRRHLCAGCGRHFRDNETSVGNPICGVRDALGLRSEAPKPAIKELELRQSDFAGGIQLWGSNPALIWTGDHTEVEGIHIHAFRETGASRPDVDETYSRVVIDGIELDPLMVRVLMAQNALPHIESRVTLLRCDFCGTAKFEPGEGAFTPSVEHKCSKCRRTFSSRGRLRKVVGNPVLAPLRKLAESAPRAPQVHRLGLVPETL